MAEAAEALEAPETDDFDAEFEAARSAEMDDAPDETGVESEPQPEPEPTKEQKAFLDQQKAFKAERAKNRELTRRLADLEARTSAPPQAQPTQAADPLDGLEIPDENVDPIGAMAAFKKIAHYFLSQRAEETRATQAQTQQQQALTRVAQAMSEAEADFRGDHPDYDQAAEHFKNARAEDLAATGLSGQALVQALTNDFAGIVARALHVGKDPAEIVYALAQKRGFGVDKAATSLQRIAKGQAASRSLAQGGSGGGSSAMSAGAIANLKGAAFDAAFEKYRAANKRG